MNASVDHTNVVDAQKTTPDPAAVEYWGTAT